MRSELASTSLPRRLTDLSRGIRLAERRLQPLMPPLLVLFAILYYGSFALSGLDLPGEGGTIAVIAQRISEGQRPIVDTFLGYNILWFYPIVWLFRITGPNFLVVRIFFFVVSLLSGLIGYRTVYRVTGRAFLGLVAALVIILIPGMQFRNYMGFLGVVNTMFLLEAFVLDHERREIHIAWTVGAGMVLALTFLFRIDLGVLFAALAIAAMIFCPIVVLREWRRRLGTSCFAMAIFPLCFWIVHLPVDLYSARAGFRTQFWDQYQFWINDLEARARSLTADAFKKVAPVRTAVPFPSPSATVAGGFVSAQPSAHTPTLPSDAYQPETAGTDRSTRPLPKFGDMFLNRDGKKRLFSFLVYYPLFATAIILSFAAGQSIEGWRRGSPEQNRDAFALVLSIGGALTLFPQYFFFRPDPPHLSEMMCPFTVATVCALGVALNQFATASRWLRTLATVCIVSTVIHLTLYMNYGIKQPWMGSIARKKQNEKLLRAENGVLAYVSSDKYREYEELYQTIMEHSKPGDYVVCFPYAPMINFMTNRPSYQYNLYVDNATRSEDFDRQAISDIEKYRPAVILIDDVAMNLTESSRFSVWAAPTLAYIRRHYAYIGTLLRNEVYVQIGH
jgi:hypothetical protein